MERVLSLLVVLAWFGWATASGNASNSSDAVNITLVASVEGVMESTTFKFSCVSNVSLSKIDLMIDGASNGAKFNRVTTDKKSNFTSDYSFNTTVDTDNGTVFTCVAHTNNKTYNSSNFILQIYYPPRLVQGNNITNLTELSDSEEQNLTVAVFDANPPVDNFVVNYVTKNDSGVKIEIDKSNTSGVVTFTDPMPENRGNYTFSASNRYGNTSFTFNTYFGGAADMLNITCTPSFGSDDAIIVCYANDYSDAPATALIVTSPGLNEPQYIQFEQIPAVNVPIPVVSRSLSELAAGNYTVTMTAVNLIKNQSVFEKTYYVPGLLTKVYIDSKSNQTVEGEVFSFTCRTPLKKYYTTFTILFDNEVINDSRIVNGSFINGTQPFNFTNPSYLDNGVRLSCSANGTYSSPALRLDVLYAPKYFGVLQSTLVNGSSGIIKVNMTANPPPDDVTWYHNNKTITSDKRLTLNASSIVFSTVTVSDSGNYTVLSSNDIGNGTYYVVPTLYFAPHFSSSNNSNIPKLVEGNDFYVLLNVTSHPPVNQSTWTINGKLVNSTGRFVTGLLNIGITDLRYTDDKSTVQIKASNGYGETTFSFDLSVLYSPKVQFPNGTLFTYVNADTTLTAVLSANPTVSHHEWYHNGVVLSSNKIVTVNNDSLSFKSITPEYNGSYTFYVENSIGNLTVETNIGVYFGPILHVTLENVTQVVTNSTNSSQWVEYEEGSTFTLSCLVNSSYPAVKKLTIQPSCHKNESDCNEIIKTDNKTFINVTITGASSKKNSKNYTCTGRTGHTTGDVTFQTFVGGAPDKTKVKITTNDDNNNVTFTMTVTDSSEAPPRTITYTDPLNGKNGSFSIPYPLINGASFVKDFLSLSVSDLQSKGKVSIEVYSSNNLPVAPFHVTSWPYTYIAPSPSPSPSPAAKKSKTTAIVTGIVVPVVVIAIIIAVIVGAYYYIKKKRRNSGFSPLRSIPDDAIPGTYGTTNS